MKDNKKDIIISIGFVMILIIVFIANIIKKDEEISISERRKLEQFPVITAKEIFNGNVSKKLEKYATDQFVKRDDLRKLKTFFNFEIYRQKDNNKLVVEDDMIYKIDYPLNKEAIQKTSKKLGEIEDKYLKDTNIYYSIIPDKSYFLDDNYLKFDYQEMQKIIDSNLKNSTYINICEELSKEDYYKTDIHWKQENLKKVVNKIENEMKLKDTSKIKYEEKEIGEFYGSLYGQLGYEIEADKIKYLTNDTIEKCTTYNYETKENGKVYDLEKYKNSKDKYDIYLSGPTSLINIENPSASNDKELLLFRDSFGSSIAHLLIQNYRKITLIDLRYINSELLTEYIEFNNQDVLFLYSGVVLNQNILK